MTTVEILKAAKQVISKPEAWCQGDEARTETDEVVTPDNSLAVKFCMLGSTFKIADSDAGRSARRFLYRTMGDSEVDLVDWNDAPERTHAEVMAKFDEAIALAEAAQC